MFYEIEVPMYVRSMYVCLALPSLTKPYPSNHLSASTTFHPPPPLYPSTRLPEAGKSEGRDLTLGATAKTLHSTRSTESEVFILA